MMAKLLLEKAMDYENKNKYSEALNCYLKIHSQKLYQKGIFENAKDEEFRSLNYLGDPDDLKIVAGATDEHLYCLDKNLNLIKKYGMGGQIRTIKTKSIDGKWQGIVVTGVRNKLNKEESRFKAQRAILFNDTLSLDSFMEIPIDEPVLKADFVTIKEKETDKTKIIISTTEGNIYLYSLNGDCEKKVVQLDQKSKITTIAVIDYNNDGKEEIIVASGNSIFIFNQEGTQLDKKRLDEKRDINDNLLVTNIFPKQRKGSSHIEGVYIASDDSKLRLLRYDDDKIKEIASFSSGLYCGQYYDLNQDDNYEILVGAKNDNLFILDEKGDIYKKITTENEVRDICIFPYDGNEVNIGVALANNQIILYGCVKNSFLHNKIKECFHKLTTENEEVAQLEEFVRSEETHLHEFVAKHLGEVFSKDRNKSIKLLEELIEKDNPSIMEAAVESAITLLRIDKDRGILVFNRLMDTRHISVKEKIWRDLSALIKTSIDNFQLRDIILNQIFPKLNKKWHDFPQEQQNIAQSYFDKGEYKNAKEICDRLIEAPLDLLLTFDTTTNYPISRIYTSDITDDGYPEILVRSQNGKIYCLNILLEKKWEIDTYDSTSISLSTANITGQKEKEVLYGTSDGHIAIVDHNGREIYKKSLVEIFHKPLSDDFIECVYSMGDNRIKIGLRDGSVISYQYLSKNLIVDDRWYFQTNNHIHSIYCFDINQDRIPELIIGSRDKYIYLLRHNGEEIDKKLCSEAICTLCVSERNKEKKPFIYVCCRNGRVDRFKFENDKLIQGKTIDLECGPTNIYYICDVDRDGEDEIVAISKDNKLNVYDQSGAVKWRYAEFQHAVTSLGYIKADLDGYPNLIIGFENGVIGCYQSLLKEELLLFRNRCEINLNKLQERRIENKFFFKEPLNSDENEDIFLSTKIASNEVVTTIKNRAENKDFFSVIVGDKGTGKSTILNYFVSNLSSTKSTIFNIDIKKLSHDNLSTFLYAFGRELAKFLQQNEKIYGFTYDEEDFEKNPHHKMNEFLDKCYSMLRDKRLFILYDNIDALIGSSIGKEATNYFNNIAIRHNIPSIFTSNTSENELDRELNIRKVGKASSGSGKLEAVFYPILNFTQEDIKRLLKLIENHCEDQNKISERILNLTDGNPYLVQLVLHQLVERYNNQAQEKIIVDDINKDLLQKISEQANSFFEFRWNKLGIDQKLLFSFVATYHDKTESKIDFNNLFKKIDYAEYLINKDQNLRPIIATLFKDGKPTLYNIWIRENWGFPLLVLGWIDELKDKIPLGSFYKIDQEMEELLTEPKKRKDFFARIALDRFSWSKIVPISKVWDGLEKSSLSASAEHNSEQLISELVRLSKFEFAAYNFHLQQYGKLYYMMIDMSHLKTLLSSGNPIIVVNKGISLQEVARNIEGIMREKRIGINVGFVILVEEMPEIESSFSKSHLDVVIITEARLKEILFSRKEIADAFWDLALSQIDISVISPYNTNEPAEIIFVGREKEIKEITTHYLERNYAVMGSRMIGKTSLLRQIKKILSQTPEIEIIYMDCRSAKSYNDFLEEIKLQAQLSCLNIDDFFSKLTSIHERTKKKLLLILDEIDPFLEYDKSNKYHFFSRLQALCGQGVCQFIIAGYLMIREATLDKDSPLLHLKNDMPLDFLDEDSAMQLIKEPLSHLGVEISEKHIKKIVAITSTHPTYIQDFCRRLVESLSAKKDKTVNLDLINEIGKSQEFLDYVDMTFLKGKVITIFEKIIVISMIQQKSSFGLDDIKKSLTEKNLPFDFSEIQLDTAIDHLIYANIFVRKGNKYFFKHSPLAEKLGINPAHRIESLKSLIEEGGDPFGYE